MKKFLKFGGILFAIFLTESRMAYGLPATPKPGIYVSCRGLDGWHPRQGNTFELGVNRNGEWVFHTNKEAWRRAGECRYDVLGDAPVDFGVSCTLHHPPTSEWMYRTTRLNIFREKNPILISRIYAYDDLDPFSPSERNQEETLVDLSGPFQACRLIEWENVE